MKKYLFIFLLICTASFVMAQTLIRGKIVTADSGQPVFGASIKVSETDLQTSSDSAGNFSLRINNREFILIISYTGFQAQKVALKLPLQSFISIQLKPDVQNLQEVTVSTGYQTIPRDRSTGSFALVDNQLFNRRVSSDILSRLEGVVPGLLFNRNTFNAANGIADISIRGTSTLFAANQPLIVLDGFPYDGDINNIDPNIVESISVLKDAAAASIWGVKSGNGVIVITTKHGSRDKKMTVDFNSNVTIGAKPDLYYNRNFLNSNDFINVEQTLFSKGYYDGNLSTPYAVVSPVVAILAKQRDGSLSAANATAQINALRNIDVRNDLTKYFYEHSVDQQYALDLSGGGVTSDYFIAGGYDNNLSNQVGNKSNRITLNSSYNFYPTKHLTISAGLNFSQTSNTANSPLANINGGGGSSIYPYAQLAGKDGTALPIVKDYASAYTDTAGSGKLYDWKYRPLDELHNADNTAKSLDNRINLSAKYNFFSGFTAEAKYEYENQKGSTSNYYSDQTYYTRNLINQFTVIDPFGNLTYQVPQGGVLQRSDASLVAQRGRLQLNYNKTWNNQHDLSVIAGSEINQTISENNQETVYGYNKNTLTDQNVDFVDYFPKKPDGSYGQIPNSQFLGKFTDRYVSYYSNAGYTYDGRYTFSLSGRIDKSNLFGVNTNQKSVPLYSTGLAWDFSKEGFYHINWLPYGKLRITYGYNGNVDKNVSALTTFQQFSGTPYTGNTYSVIVSPGNPELRWERDRIINFGFDYALKNNIVSGSFEYYVKNGVNLFGDTPLAPSTGFSTFRGNTADIKGNGFDLVLNTNIIRNENFQWQSNFLLSHVLDKVTKYDAQLDVTGYLEVGDGNAGTIYPLTNRPLYAIYSYKWAGLTHDTGDPQGFLNGQPSTDYASIISGTTTSNMVFNGPSRPTTFGSFRNTFSYRRLSLSANIIYKLNYYFRRSSINYTSLYNNWIGNADFDKRWQKPGDEMVTNVPSMPLPPLDQNRETFYEFSSALVDKGDHIRLQDIDISYDLIGKTSKRKLAFNRLQVYSYINNVGILWRANREGLDPDLFSGSLPIPRTISFGIKATL
jgi:TonB-linked SusC/RagA family outer membrane protein